MIERIFAALISFLMSVLSFFGIILPHYDTYPNIKYGESAMQTMDIYVPYDAEDNAENSAVIFLHGGMFKSGDKSEMIDECKTLADKGFITVTMDYSLIGGNTKISMRTMLEDIDNALDKLSDFSIEKGLNIKKIALAGNSAGGTLALYYSYYRSIYSQFDIAFAAAKTAPTDFDFSIWSDNYSKETFADLVSRLSGQQITGEELDSVKGKEICQNISPVKHLTSASKIPTLLGFAVKDTTVPYGNKASIENKLKEVKGSYDIIDFTNSNHDLSFDILQKADYDNLLLSYCQKYF